MGEFRSGVLRADLTQLKAIKADFDGVNTDGVLFDIIQGLESTINNIEDLASKLESEAESSASSGPR